MKPSSHKGYEEFVGFPLIDALMGRRARRFAFGAEIKGGPFSYKSKQSSFPLSRHEQSILLMAMGGVSGWHYMHPYNHKYDPEIPNYSSTAVGRTFPSSAGFHTSELFYTDDEGTYFLSTRDAVDLSAIHGECFDVERLSESYISRVVRLSNTRLQVPLEEPHVEAHNLWCANAAGSTMIFPVGDLAQHTLAAICYLVRGGFSVYDDINNARIEGLDEFKDLIDLEHPYPLSFLEQLCLGELTAELSTSCFAGALSLQAMGLGGWMYDGMSFHSVLGASGDPKAPGLGFSYESDQRWPLPNPTGLKGVFEGFCPPFYRDMRAAVDALAERKFGGGGPFNPETPGPWSDNKGVRASGGVFSEEFKECVALIAQYVYDRFGKFPGTVPSMWMLTFLQAHHLDLGFYDAHFAPGAYLGTHRKHMEWWHKST